MLPSLGRLDVGAFAGAFIGALGAAVLTAPAFAHHSFASFDLERIVRLDGVVVEFQWTNPHAWLEVDAVAPDGATERWGIEFNSPNNLTRQGWSRDSLEPGDAISVVFHPMRDGQPGGFFYEVSIEGGETITTAPRSFDPAEGFDSSTAPDAYAER